MAEQIVDTPTPQEQPTGDTAAQTAPAPVDFEAGLEAELTKLPDEQKALIAAHLTPEFAQVIGILFGDEVGTFFQNRANPNMILVPQRREETQAQVQQETPQGAIAPSGTAAPQAVQPQPTPGPSGGMLR